MEQQRKNKEFIINYFNAISGVEKPRELLAQYIDDEGLIGHIEYFEAAFPKYELFIDELTAENNRVVVTARIKAIHLGELSGIAATGKTVNFSFVIRYEIENNRIASSWMLADQMSLMEQLRRYTRNSYSTLINATNTNLHTCKEENFLKTVAPYLVHFL